MKKALIAMSGGVDSSVAAYLTKEKGLDCIGCMMKLYDGPEGSGGRTCCSEEDAFDARSVAIKLGIPFYVFNYKDPFREKIIDRFISCYEAGITPNPCIDCNRFMKFGCLMERAAILGCDYTVTGHYARIEQTDEGFILKKSADPSKDQSYVLYSLTQEQLSHILFPLGDLSKDDTRRIAEENGFVNASKPDSQDICFVPDGDYASVIKKYSGKIYTCGKFVDLDGNILGEHKGLINYTIGQRKGLGVSSDRPLYVCDINSVTNEVVLGSNEDLFRTDVNVMDVNRIIPYKNGDSIRCKVKIRYRQTEQPCVLTFLDGDRATLKFDEPQRAVTKGQAAVFYDGDIVIGGGTIC